jgi:hypothetical protein
MRPTRRARVDKYAGPHRDGSAKQFRRDVSTTHPRNVKPRPMRGGWRL